MELTVKITPRVAAEVARRLRLAASVRSRSMSAVVNDALDAALPSLEEIRMQLAAPAAGESGVLADARCQPSRAGHGDHGPGRRRGSRRWKEGRAMAAFAEDRAGRWEPFGVTEADFAAVPERDGVRVVNVKLGSSDPGRLAARWLGAAAGVLAVLAAAAAAVSWQAQYTMVCAVKHVAVVAGAGGGHPGCGRGGFRRARRGAGPARQAGGPARGR